VFVEAVCGSSEDGECPALRALIGGVELLLLTILGSNAASCLWLVYKYLLRQSFDSFVA